MPARARFKLTAAIGERETVFAEMPIPMTAQEWDEFVKIIDNLRPVAVQDEEPGEPDPGTG